MSKQEIAYCDINGVMQNAVFASFEEAWPLIQKLDRQNVYYDWYELRKGQWVEASEVTVLQDEEDEDISLYLTGKVA